MLNPFRAWLLRGQLLWNSSGNACPSGRSQHNGWNL